MNWDNVTSNPWVVGIACSFAAAFVWRVWRRVFGGRRRQTAISGGVQQNASPVMSQSYQPSFQPTINIHTPAVATPPPATQGAHAASVEGTLPRAPNLTYAGYKQTTVYISRDPRRGISDQRTDAEFEDAEFEDAESEKALQALTLKFENRPILGQTVGRAINVIAKLSFRSPNRETERILDYGAWLNSPCESVGIDPGDTRRLVVMCADNNHLVTFGDKRAQGSFVRRLPRRMTSYLPYLEREPVDGLELLDVALTEKNTQTIVTYAFRVRWDEGSFCVSQL